MFWAWRKTEIRSPPSAPHYDISGNPSGLLSGVPCGACRRDSHRRATRTLRYSPECVEGAFSEVDRINGGASCFGGDHGEGRPHAPA
jgi:hypothetical protein